MVSVYNKNVVDEDMVLQYCLNLVDFKNKLKESKTTAVEKKEFRVFNDTMVGLEDFVLNSDFSIGFQNKVISKIENDGMLKEFQDFFEFYEVSLEKCFSKALKEGRVEMEDYALFPKFHRLINGEIELGDISKTDKVLFIGSGPFPISSILFNKYSGCSVDCYDMNEKAVEYSIGLLDSLSLSDDIRVYNKDGRDVFRRKYDKIVIALLAKPKDEIITNAYGSLKEGGKIICRNSIGLRQLFYESSGRLLEDKYRYTDSKVVSGDNIISSFLLR